MDLPTALVIFQTSIERIRDELAAIQTEWTALGIDTPVLDDEDYIHPDALDELSERL